MLYGWIQLKRVSMRIQIRCLKQSTDVDYHVAKWFHDTHMQLVEVVQNYIKKQEGK